MKQGGKRTPGVSDEVVALRRRVRRLKAVAEAGALTNRTLDVKAVAERIVSLATRLIGAERGSLFILDPEQGILTSLVATGADPRAFTLNVGEGIVGTVAATGRALILRDPYRDRRFDRTFDEATGFRTRSLLTVPVKDREGTLVAVLQLLNHRNHGFSSEDLTFLKELGDPFTVALSNARLHAAQVEQARMREELRLAAQIQQALRPSDLSVVPGLDIAVLSRPCREVGGDYFDLIPRADGSWWVVMADISGKGVAAGLIASNVQAFLWSRRDQPEPLEHLFSDGNELLCRLTQGLKYATLALAQWHPEGRELNWINAGHPPMLLGRSQGVEQLRATGPPLGLIPGLPYAAGHARLEPGDHLLFYTDGVSEAGGEAGGNDFGLDRVVDCLGGAASPQQVVQTVADRVTEFLHGGSPRDDLTLLCARCLA